MEHYLIKPNPHTGIYYHKLTLIQRLEYIHSLQPDMRNHEYDKYRKTDYPTGIEVDTPHGIGLIKSKDLFSYGVALPGGLWRWINEGDIKLITK